MLRVSTIFLSLSLGIFAIGVPSGINRCPLKYPDVYQCVIDEGNRLIPLIVKGNEELGIPSISPIRASRVEVHAPDFDLILTDAFFDSFKDFKMIDTNFDYGYKNLSLAFHSDFLNVTANYSIDDGKILSRKISGNGRSDISLADNTIRYKSNLDYREINGETYFKSKDVVADLDVKRAYFYFEGLRSSENGIELDDTDDFVDRNWKTIVDLIKPRFEEGLRKAFQSVVDPVHQRLPADKFFTHA